MQFLPSDEAIIESTKISLKLTLNSAALGFVLKKKIKFEYRMSLIVISLETEGGSLSIWYNMCKNIVNHLNNVKLNVIINNDFNNDNRYCQFFAKSIYFDV